MIDLKLDHVSKKYLVGQDRGDSAGQNRVVRKLKSLRRPSQEFWAVRDVSFEVPRGQALGIIGHNGAGKSTMLKMLAGITAPTEGEIFINGRLAALIEVGSGLHPEFTGRENVFLSGSIRGMSRREIKEKFDSIIDFAGIRQFVDTPIKRYSSGMHVRLGFSIAAHLESDILLLDEVLAVGDANFRAKCHKRIEGLKEAGKTIVFISHDLKSVEQVCDRVIMMQRGQLIADGDPQEVIKEYMKASAKGASAKLSSGVSTPSKTAEIQAITFPDVVEGDESTALRTGRPARIRVHYTAHERLTDVALHLGFLSQEGYWQCQLSTLDGGRQIDVEAKSGMVEFYCPAFSLMPGSYYLTASIRHRQEMPNNVIDYRPNFMMISVGAGDRPYPGRFYMPHESRLIEEDEVEKGQHVGTLSEMASQV